MLYLHLIGLWKVDFDIIVQNKLSPPTRPWLHQKKTNVSESCMIQSKCQTIKRFVFTNTGHKSNNLYVKAQKEAERRFSCVMNFSKLGSSSNLSSCFFSIRA